MNEDDLNKLESELLKIEDFQTLNRIVFGNFKFRNYVLFHVNHIEKISHFVPHYLTRHTVFDNNIEIGKLEIYCSLNGLDKILKINYVAFIKA